MSDPQTRRSNAINRLRQQLKKKRESLADQFDFRMYTIFHFRDKKSPAIYEMAEVLPVMTNNYEDSILKGVKEECYSYESSIELLEKDVVQLHAPRWQPMRRDVIGCTTDMDFFLWPRNDIERVNCLLFSRWKGDEDEPFRRINAEFDFSAQDYEKQLMRLLQQKEKSGLIVNNPVQSMFLFVDKRTIQTTKNIATVFKLSSVCLYLPQDQLMYWSSGTIEEELNQYIL